MALSFLLDLDGDAFDHNFEYLCLTKGKSILKETNFEGRQAPIYLSISKLACLAFESHEASLHFKIRLERRHDDDERATVGETRPGPKGQHRERWQNQQQQEQTKDQFDLILLLFAPACYSIPQSLKKTQVECYRTDTQKAE